VEKYPKLGKFLKARIVNLRQGKPLSLVITPAQLDMYRPRPCGDDSEDDIYDDSFIEEEILPDNNNNNNDNNNNNNENATLEPPAPPPPPPPKPLSVARASSPPLAKDYFDRRGIRDSSSSEEQTDGLRLLNDISEYLELHYGFVVGNVRCELDTTTEHKGKGFRFSCNIKLTIANEDTKVIFSLSVPRDRIGYSEGGSEGLRRLQKGVDAAMKIMGFEAEQVGFEDFAKMCGIMFELGSIYANSWGGSDTYKFLAVCPLFFRKFLMETTADLKVRITAADDMTTSNEIVTSEFAGISIIKVFNWKPADLAKVLSRFIPFLFYISHISFSLVFSQAQV
jgi:hypothetical protein